MTEPSRPSDDASTDLRLADVGLQEEVELVRLDVPEHQLERLLERGFLPGCRLCKLRTSPWGDPIVSLDGSVLALRRELAGCLCVKRAAEDLG